MALARPRRLSQSRGASLSLAMAMKKSLVVLLAAFSLSLAAPDRADADPSAVCSPLHPVAMADVEVRIYGATWCGACAETERFLAGIGATDSASVLVDGRRVSVRLRHLDVDSITETERAAMRGDGIRSKSLIPAVRILSTSAPQYEELTS